MVEFRIDVIVDPKQAKKGIKEVDKGLIKIGSTADNVRNQIARLFKFAAIAYAVKQVIELADAYTNLQNRLRVVTKGQEDLISTTERLLAVANRSRSSFEGTAELYTRVALATRQMGVAQSDLAGIVETVNKSIILSGASAKEANNGLIQLSQGIASNRLGGDELRSVLEQLPVVADVIAKQMGVTRGEMRALGAEGKITGDVIIEAFKNAREEIEQKFKKTVPTLAQSWVVLKNNLLAYLGTVNTSTGILGALGATMRALGENINFVAKSLLTLGTVFAAVKLAPHVQNVHNAVKAYLAFRSAVKAGTVVVLGSAEAERQKAAASLASLGVERQNLIAAIARAKAEVAKTSAIYGSRNAIIAQRQAMIKLRALEASLVPTQEALNVAMGQYAVASRAASRESSLFYRALGKVKTGIKAVTGAIAANPLGALLIALTAIIAPLIIFRNEIKLAEDNLATLGDLGTVVWGRIKKAFEGFANAFSQAMSFIAELWGKTWENMDLSVENVLLFIASFVDTTIGLFKGLFNAILAIFGGFPRAFSDIFISTINSIIKGFEFLGDGIYAVLLGIQDYFTKWYFYISTLFRELGTSLKLAMAGSADEALRTAENAWNLYKRQIVSLDLAGSIGNEFDKLQNTDFLPQLENTFEGGVKNLGESIINAFKEGLEGKPVEEFVIDIINEAEKLANARILDKFKAAGEGGEGGGPVVERAPQVEQLLKELRAQQMILEMQGLTNEQRSIENELLRIRNSLEEKKVKYTKGDLLKIKNQLEYNQALKAQNDIVQEIRGPMEQLKAKEDALIFAFLNRKITIEEFNAKLRELAITAAEAGKSIEDGITRGLAAVEDRMTDMASVVENVFVNAFASAEDALVDFVMTGKFSFRDFATGIIRDITRVIARLLLLQAIQAITGTGPASGAAANIGARAEGGSVKKHEPVIVGEKGPELFNPETSGVVIPNDVTAAIGQMQQEPPVINIAPPPPANVTVINSIDSGEMVSSGLNTEGGEQAVLNIISRNRDNVKRSLG